MGNWNIKPVQPSDPNGKLLRQIVKNVEGMRNLRPLTGVFGTKDLPWGQSVTPGNADWVIAYTAGGIPKATRNSDGSLLCGKGEAYEAYPSVASGTGALTIDYHENTSNPFPVYNIAYNDDGDVGAGRWIIAVRIWTLWIVIYEECPDTAA